jgi:hypothetical protein
MSESEDPIKTDRTPSVQLRGGKLRLALPLTQIIGGLLAAGGMAWGVTERVLAARAAEVEAKAASVERRLADLELRAIRTEQALAVDQALLASINAKLSDINARVAEVQVTLMRERRP